jgi:hypothetical protein
MTTKASELAAMTYRTSLRVLGRLARGVTVQPVIGVRSGFQVSILGVTLGATERRFDFVMADKTIRHLRKCR